MIASIQQRIGGTEADGDVSRGRAGGAIHRRPRIGVFDLGLGASGISRYVTDLLTGIDQRNFELTLFCHPDGPYPDLDVPGVHVVHATSESNHACQDTQDAQHAHAAIPRRTGDGWLKERGRQLWRQAMPQPGKHLVGFLRDSARLIPLFQAHPVDLLHIQIVSNSHAGVAGRIAGIPRILGTFHLDPGRCRLDAVIPEMLTTCCLHRGIAVSESTRSAWCGRPAMGPSRIKVIPNGVDVRRYRRARERRDARRELSLPDSCSHVLAIVGRLEEQKGHRFLLDAIQHLRGTFPGVCVLVAGDGSLRADLQEKAQTLGIERHVRFLGHCGNIQSVLDASDVFVLSSLWEALPFALLEAMASGLPIVATAVAGVPELVLHGETGFLVQPADPTGLASALRTLMASEELRASMGMAGQERVEREFSQRSMLAKTEETYRELLKPTCR